MKRTYIKPIVKMVIIDHEPLLTASGGADTKGTTPEITDFPDLILDDAGGSDLNL